MTWMALPILAELGDHAIRSLMFRSMAQSGHWLACSLTSLIG